MRSTQWIGTGLVSAALVIATGCSKSTQPPGTQATPTPQATPNAAPAVPPTTMSPIKTATAVDFEQLIALLPEPAGWTRSKPHGKQISLGGSMSYAEAGYENGESSIRLEITDSSFNPLYLAPKSIMLGSTYSERTTDGYKKAAPLGGSPGFEEWENEPREGAVTVVVANRFIVTARGRNVENVDAVRSLVRAVDLSKLAALK